MQNPIPTLLACLLMPVAASAACAQPVTPAELRREIDTLKADNLRLGAQVETLTTQLESMTAERDAARARADQLAAAVAQLREDLRLRGEQTDDPTTERPEGPAPVAAPPTHAPIPEDPMAAPASLLAELERRYAEELGTEHADPAARLSAERRRVLEDWCRTQARALRGPIEWRVRFTSLTELRRNERAALMTVIDSDSGLPIGPTIEVAVPRAHADRLARELGLAGGEDKSALFTLTGTLIAAPKVNADRPTPGVFNHPAFIGAYVEFAFDLDWRTLVVVPRQEAEPAGGPAVRAPGA